MRSMTLKAADFDQSLRRWCNKARSNQRPFKPPHARRKDTPPLVLKDASLKCHQVSPASDVSRLPGRSSDAEMKRQCSEVSPSLAYLQ